MHPAPCTALHQKPYSCTPQKSGEMSDGGRSRGMNASLRDMPQSANTKHVCI
ncbi:predicted protein [Plenodomus lingam JN3]|uniref:Predicted protein n=1 Tax=Leptosphaeria maculans (strain JN3 / isolate v23.1.3 / race Av1-4-5-6-7-8) TaxID=985895 RepID=E5ADT5_LEPMJ|nr:predicted protein [Plenodomus lingam JN3]CBY01374.1 predicted protein [Plenodomus lingam JN3]